MARVTYGALVTELRGSLGGTVFQRNAYGFSGKNKPAMARLQSSYQQGKHQLVSYVSQMWLSIGQSNRDGWNAWAVAHPYPSKHNPSSNISGYAYFMKYNLMRCICGVNALAFPNEGTLTLPVISPSLVNDGTHLYFNLNATFDNILVSYNSYMSPPVRESIGYQQNKTRYIVFDYYRALDIDILAAYIARFNSAPAVGSFVFIEVQPWGSSMPFMLNSQYFRVQVT